MENILSFWNPSVGGKEEGILCQLSKHVSVNVEILDQNRMLASLSLKMGREKGTLFDQAQGREDLALGLEWRFLHFRETM